MAEPYAGTPGATMVPMPPARRLAASVVAWAVVAAALAGCARDSDDALRREAGAPTTVTSAVEATTTTSELPPTTTTTEDGLTLAEAQPATEACPAVPAHAQPDADRPVYRLSLDIDLEANAVEGRLVALFVPDLDTDRLVFRLWPNGPRPSSAGTHLETGPVQVDGDDRPSELTDPTTLVVPLPGGLRAGTRVEVAMPWRLTLPGPANDRISRDGDAVRLGSFYPILPWEPGVGWALDPPTTAFAEAGTSPTADYTMTITAPDGLDVMASGTEVDDVWTATAVRDVAVSVGRFRTVRAVAHAPNPVEVTVGVHEGTGEDPQPYLDRTVAALEDFATRFGPYPWPTHALAITPGLRGGIEYPGLVLQGPGTLARTTSHEVGHLWFYGIVGNNQGRDPWLDEGLASWAEARFEGTLGQFVARDIPSGARGRAGEPMTFWEGRQADYYRGVYVQGAQALAALGDPDRVDCALRHYVAANAFGIARPADVATALGQVFDRPERTLAVYGLFP
jgi:hypothetical protein